MQELMAKILDEQEGLIWSPLLEDSATGVCLRDSVGVGRKAEVLRADYTQYSLIIDDAYSASWIQEDLTLDEEESEIRRLISVANAYLEHGAEIRATRFFRRLYLVINVEGQVVEVHSRPGGTDHR